MDDGPNLLTFLTDVSSVYPGLGKEPMQLLEIIPQDMQNPTTTGADDSDDDNNDTILADIDDRLPSDDGYDEDECVPVLPSDTDALISTVFRRRCR